MSASKSSKSSRTGAATKAAHHWACRCPRCRGRRRRDGLPEPEAYHVSKSAERRERQAAQSGPEPSPPALAPTVAPAAAPVTDQVTTSRAQELAEHGALAPQSKPTAPPPKVEPWMGQPVTADPTRHTPGVARSRKRATRPTAAITAAAVRYLKAGCPLDVAAKILLGARSGELYRWLLVGSGQEPTMIRVPKPYRDFHDRVVRAMAEAEARNVRVLQKGGNPKWALAWLRARAPHQWGAKDPAAGEALVPHTTKDGRVLMVPAALAAFLERSRSEQYVDPRDRAAADDQEPEPIEPVTAAALEGGEAAHPALQRVVELAPVNQSVGLEAPVPLAPGAAAVPELAPCTCATEHAAIPRTATWWSAPVPPATPITVDVKLVDGKWQDDTGRIIPEDLLNPLPPCVGCVRNKQASAHRPRSRPACAIWARATPWCASRTTVMARSQHMHKADFEQKFQVRVEALTVVPEDPPPPQALMF